jgi:hyaluronate lyase
LNAIKARLTALETRATNLEGRATSLEGRATALETGLATTNTNLATTNTNLATTNTNLATTNTNLTTTNTNLATTNTNLTTTNTKVGVIEGIVNPPFITSSGSNSTKPTGSNFTYQIVATNNPASYGASGLPSGLSVNTSNGSISGTITAGPGSFPVTVSATNLGGTGTKSFTITVT